MEIDLPAIPIPKDDAPVSQHDYALENIIEIRNNSRAELAYTKRAFFIVLLGMAFFLLAVLTMPLWVNECFLK